ncbi:peptidoglycan-binding protein [Amycolatopsis sp. NPDC057786]|uniref:peptidoglycan-binding protein n=1 Tax=Amycolatopsis sp. NPDC057786 TaxID=3346250 RepID=UPI00366D9374
MGRRRSTMLATLAAVAVAAGVTATLVLNGGDDAGQRQQTRPGKTTEVRRQTLVEHESLPGRLGYAGKYDVFASGDVGVVTALPKIGDVVDRGAAVYFVNDVAVPLLFGDKPLWRELRQGMTAGADVRLLEENLKALGYGGFTVDDRFDGATAAAVRSWQKKIGHPRTGTIAVGAVVITPGPLRVSELTVRAGGPAQGKVLSGTGTMRLVVVDVPADRQALVVADAEVNVVLPGGARTRGRVGAVGKVAVAREGKGSVIETEVVLTDPAAVGALDAAPVQVEFAGESRKDVLVVPVGALLALPEGGHAVEVVDGTGARKVAVELGMFAAGQVEVSGPELREGVQVKVAGV